MHRACVLSLFCPAASAVGPSLPLYEALSAQGA
jgi:hypothetical protein